MIMTPSSFTLEHLKSLKFKELQKLSSQYQVNKRWAKKQELIDNLLALKEKNDDENEWRDGSIVVHDLKPSNDTEVNRRLTFNVKKESQKTFDVPQNGKNLLGKINPRETFDVPPNMSILGVEPIIDSRATFDIPAKEKLIDIDPRATFDVPQAGNLLTDQTASQKNTKKNGKSVKLNNETEEGKNENSNLIKGLKKLKFDMNVKNGEEKDDKGKSQIKTLTIPCVRIPRRTRKDGEILKNDSALIKMSNKSINIKKSTRPPVTKNNLIRSPAVSLIKKSANKESIKSLTIPQDMNMGQRQVTSKFEPVNEISELVKSKNTNENGKENVKTILRKRHSKTENVLTEKSTSNKVNFATPPQSGAKATKILPIKKTPIRRENEGKNAVKRLSSNTTQTPGAKGSVIKKPITATKMPDFAKIHKRQFEQMDSLHDYIKKKEERIRKLFGTPQPKQNSQALNKSAPVFHFKSSEKEKGNNVTEGFKSALTLSKKKENAVAQKEAMKSRLPRPTLRTDVKDRNRSHIHGVRTNKRFELQMKFRNI